MNIERYELLKNEIKKLEDEQLNLEIQLEEMPTLLTGTKIVDKVENVGELTECDEKTGWISIDFGDDNIRTFDASVAMGLAIKLVNFDDRKIYKERSQLRHKIKTIENQIEEKRNALKQLE